jgi:hypothetical protein
MSYSLALPNQAILMAVLMESFLHFKCTPFSWYPFGSGQNFCKLIGCSFVNYVVLMAGAPHLHFARPAKL